MAKAQDQIKKQQQVWAQRHNILFDRNGYVLNLTDNLLEPMRSDAEAEYGSGAGGELQGKMHALHSSSALVCNFFHYWRYREVGIMSKALGLGSDYTSLTFEKTYPKPTGIVGILPHVDVELTGEKRKPVAIESKFTEQYDGKQKTLKEVYVQKKSIWGHLSGCESLANRIVDRKDIFEYLDAPQLLKHILGLKTETEHSSKSFKLLYPWYRIEGTETEEHEKELRRFVEAIGNEVDFEATTYQELFQRLKSIAKGHEKYIGYMQERYFSTTRS